MKLFTSIIVLLWFFTSNVFSQNLLFKSGFEDTVKLSPPIANGGQWYQYFTGKDLSSGYEWPVDLPTKTQFDAYWTFKVPDTTNLSNYAQVQIDTTESHGGEKSLYMEISDYNSGNFDNSMQGHVRCEYRLNLDTNLKQAYIKYWMKLQPNFYDDITLFGTNRWRMIMEWFESGQSHSDYRWNLKPMCSNFINDSTSAYWRMSKQYQVGPGNQGDFILDSAVYIQQLAPVGEWFQIEVYWKHAVDSSGRIWGAINGNTLFDFYGRNKNDTFPSPLSNWQIFKLYVDEPSMDDGLVYQWIDDVEIWDTIPYDISTINTSKHNNTAVSVYPNPSRDIIQFEIQGEKNAVYDLKVFNAKGKLIINNRAINNKHVIHNTQLKPGLYLYAVTDKQSSRVTTGKFIKQ